MKGDQWNVTRLACPAGSVLLLHAAGMDHDEGREVAEQLRSVTGLPVYLVAEGVHVQVAPPGSLIEVDNPLAEEPEPET